MAWTNAATRDEAASRLASSLVPSRSPLVEKELWLSVKESLN